MRNKEENGNLFFQIIDIIIEQESVTSPKVEQNPLKNIIRYYLPEYKDLAKDPRILHQISASLYQTIEKSTKAGEPPPFETVFGMPLKRIPFNKVEQSYSKRIREKSNSLQFCSFIKETRPDEVEKIINFYGDTALNQPPLLLKNKFTLHHQSPIFNRGKNTPNNLIFLPLAEHKVTHEIITAQENAIKKYHLNSDIYVPFSTSCFLIPEEYTSTGFDLIDGLDIICKERTNIKSERTQDLSKAIKNSKRIMVK